MRRVPLILAALVFATAALAQSAWQTTTAPDAVFTFEMPGKPQYEAKPLQSKNGPTYTMHQYLVEEAGRAFVVQTAVYPNSVNVSDPKANLQAGIDNSAKGMEGGKWVSVRWLKHQGLTAVEAVGVRNGHAIRNYSVLKGRRIIALTYSGPPGTALAPDPNQFVGSLKIK